jgi:HK97 gp10 family phage protein
VAVIEINITGLDKIEAALENMPIRASRQIMRTGLKFATFIWQREMESRVRQGWHHAKGKNAQRQFGFIANHVETKVTVKSDLEGTAGVGPAKSAFWAKFLEFGTSKAPAYPFIRAAFESRKQDVLDEFIIETKAALEREGMKLE